MVATTKVLISFLNIHEANKKVSEKVAAYSKAVSNLSNIMLRDIVVKQQVMDILEWIWPESQKYSTPKGPDEDNVEKSGGWFLRSDKYIDWVGQGPSTLICIGQRNFPFLYERVLHRFSRSREITSRVSLPHLYLFF